MPIPAVVAKWDLMEQTEMEVIGMVVTVEMEELEAKEPRGQRA